MSERLVYLATNYIELRELTNTLSDSAVTDATVTVSLEDLKTGDPVEGVTWPATMSHVGSGTYRYTAATDLAVTKGRAYVATIIAVSGSLSRTFREIIWVRGSNN